MNNVYRLPAPPAPFEFEAPSGLRATVRKIKGAELNALAQASDDDTADNGFGSVIGPCWVETLSAGPYPNVKVGTDRPNFGTMLKGDLLFMFLYLRRISMPDGNAYDFDVMCEECQIRYPWTLNLSDLPVQHLSPESAAIIKVGKSFSTTVPSDGRAVTFNLSMVTQEAEIAALMKRQKRDRATMIDLLAAQAVSIEGVNPDIRARWRFLSDLDIDDLYRLREAFEAVDCGVDTAIQTRCTSKKCRWTQDLNLPLGRSFFARRRPRALEPIETDDESEDTDSSSAASSASTESAFGRCSPSSGGTSTGGAATGA